MTCTHCGANLIDEKICPYCRCRVEIPAPAPASDPQNYIKMPGNSARTVSQLPAKANPMPLMMPGQNLHYKKPALLMCLLGFIGLGGIHRLYTGKIGTGLLYLFSGGLFGIGTLIDLILILMNYFQDKNGNQLQ